MKPLPPAVDPVYLDFQAAVAGRYSIDRELGRGGMGIVYLAHEVHLDRLVAIKLLPPDKAADPALKERFLREAQLAARLSHPNIIPIHTVAEEGGFVFYVMSFIDGETLANRVRTRGPLVGSEAVRILREVAWALAHAHSMGLVHRDVKPDNILIEASSGRALVADFGIAAAVGDRSGRGIVAGTPEFMSPEQASGETVDARSDLYSFGATAFYACSGSLPFEGKTATEILARHLAAPAPPLGSLGVPVPRKLAGLVDRCLAKEPDRRPPSAEDVAEHLGVALEQRRELPAALRAFVKRSARLNGAGTLLAAGTLISTSTAAASIYGPKTGLATFLLGAGVGKLGYFLNAARKLLRQGFTFQDVAPAFQREQEQASEELAFDQSRSSMLLERGLKVAAITGTSVLATSFLAAVTWSDWYQVIPREFVVAATQSLVALIGVSGAIGLGSWIGYLALVQRRRDVDTDFWGRLWTGPFGKAMFALARRTVRVSTVQGNMTHRPTEMSLGLAAENLFDGLPKATRHELRDVPAVMQRLRADAGALRERLTHLNAGLSDSGPAAHEEFRALRNEAQARLSDTVAALETIRLNLLRLHAGQASVSHLTTNLSAAADVSAAVERLVAAHDEINESLRLPREVASTPL